AAPSPSRDRRSGWRQLRTTQHSATGASSARRMALRASVSICFLMPATFIRCMVSRWFWLSGSFCHGRRMVVNSDSFRETVDVYLHVGLTCTYTPTRGVAMNHIKTAIAASLCDQMLDVHL